METVPKHLSQQHGDNSVAIFITGFGKFQNVGTNPTQALVESITPAQKKKFGIREAAVLDVSCQAVDSWLQNANTKAQSIVKDKPVWLVHFGVGPNTVYHLEQTAYNNKDFHSPDNSGYQCRNEVICEDLKIQHALRTETDLPGMCKDLKTCHKSLVSQDPGRFLCNYIFFKSLNDISCPNPRINSLFVHVPSQQYTSLEQNREFLFDLCSWLHKFTKCNDQGCTLKV